MAPPGPTSSHYFSEIIGHQRVRGQRQKESSQEDAFLGDPDRDQISPSVPIMPAPFRYEGLGLGSCGEIEPLRFGRL